MKIPKSSLSISLVLAICGNLLHASPLLFPQGGYNGLNLYSGYQSRPQNQISWIGNYPAASGTFSQKDVNLLLRDILPTGNTGILPATSAVPTTGILPAATTVPGTTGILQTATIVPGGTTAVVPAGTLLPAGSAVQYPSTVADPSLTGPIGTIGSPIGLPPVGNSISNPLSTLNPCAAAALLGLLGNLIQSSLCCSSLGALSPCSPLGLISPLSTVGLPLGGILPNLGGVTQVPNLLPGGLGGCQCNGLNAQLSTPCCNSPVINLILGTAPTLIPGIPQAIPNPSTLPPVIPAPLPDPTGTSVLPVDTLPVVGRESNSIVFSSQVMS